MQHDFLPLASMTGFARAAGAHGACAFAWEIRAVNSKGLDLRLRLPPGFDGLDAPVRASLGRRISRGAVHVNLSLQREAAAPKISINEALLAALAQAARAAGDRAGLPLASLDPLLAVRGIIEISEAAESEEERAALNEALLTAFEGAVKALAEMRIGEGTALRAILLTRCDAMARLAAAAEANPARSPAAIERKLSDNLRQLLGASPQLDPQRLHQEALLLAGRSDVREELDRLALHVRAVRELLEQGGAVGRRLDFLAQELAREANTLCAKSNDSALTATGLELRGEIEQMREQIQNVE